MEIRFALIRYFRKYPYREAEEFLLALLDREKAEFSGLAIAAAAALSAYPGKKTKEALRRALSSRNWYVRRNAAVSLKELGLIRKICGKFGPVGTGTQ